MDQSEVLLEVKGTVKSINVHSGRTGGGGWGSALALGKSNSWLTFGCEGEKHKQTFFFLKCVSQRSHR